MFQKHNIDPFYFAGLDKRKQAFYIACEQLEEKDPKSYLGRIFLLLKAYMTRKRKRR